MSCTDNWVSNPKYPNWLRSECSTANGTQMCRTFSKTKIILPGAEAETSAAGEEPNQREIKLRFWGAAVPDESDDWRCSGDWADGLDSTTAAAEGGRGEDAGTEGDCGGTWEGRGG